MLECRVSMPSLKARGILSRSWNRFVCNADEVVMICFAVLCCKTSVAFILDVCYNENRKTLIR